MVLSYGLSVRYLIPTGLLDRIAEFADPVVAVSWDDDELTAVLEARGAVVARLPDPMVSHAYRRLERLLDIGFYQRLASPTTRISRGWRKRTGDRRAMVLTTLRQARDEVLHRVPGRVRAWEREIAASEATATNLAEFTSWLEQHRIDAVVSFTPYHRPDHLALAAAHRLGLATLVSIISFDNPTTRGRMPALEAADRVLVWNRFNRDEVLRAYPSLSPDDVRVAGAPQFDLHHDRRWLLTDQEWRQQLDLPPDRPVILYGAGPELLVPGEERLVAALAAAISAGRIPGDPIVLVRTHPADDAARWRGVEDAGRVVVAPSWGRADGGLAWPSDHDTALQLSTLAHAIVHVSICSSMAIDGAAYDRPTVAPTVVPGATRSAARRVRSFYRQEHWQPIAATGAVDQPGTVDAVEHAIVRRLADPGRGHDQRQALVRELLTFDDGRSSERVAGELRDLLVTNPSPAAEPRLA